jgi:predicted RNA-binding Zn ribbon-like protein
MAQSREPAPGDLELVRAFVNTRDVEDGSDELESPAALDAWLAAHELLGEGAGARPADLKRAVAVREALRALLLANNGGPAPGEAAIAALTDAARAARLAVAFDGRGTARLAPAAEGPPAALGSLLAIVAAAQAEGTWPRLKACAAADCRWAFYDRSRNRSALWCSMQVCGNRAKVRAYRARTGTRAAAPTPRPARAP